MSVTIAGTDLAMMMLMGFGLVLINNLMLVAVLDYIISYHSTLHIQHRAKIGFHARQ